MFHQLRYAVCDCICGRKQDSIRRMYVPRSGRTSLVSDQRRDNGLAVTEVRGEARKAVPQYVRRYVGGQPAELGNALPQLFKAGHDNITGAARRRKHQMTRAWKVAQHIAGCKGERTHTPTGFSVAERCRAAR